MGGGSRRLTHNEAVLEIASTAGRILLENGAEIYRTEQTIQHICSAYGMKGCECFAMPTALIISVIGRGGEAHTMVRRIKARRVDLNKVDAVNTFSRSLNMDSPTDEVRRRLRYIDRLGPYPQWVRLLASAVGAGAFSVMFGGNFANLAGGMLAGAAACLAGMGLERLEAGEFLANMMGGAVCTLCGWAATALGISADWWVVTLSTLMLLVPGMLITNALRNIAAGDLVSGGSNGAEALSIAAALSGGTVVCSAILQALGNITLWS